MLTFSIAAYLVCTYLFFFRGLFIIDDKGNLRQITINDLPVGRSVDETLRLVQAFQFTDKHGEGEFVVLLQVSHKLWKSWKTWKITKKRFHAWKNHGI